VVVIRRTQHPEMERQEKYRGNPGPRIKNIRHFLVCFVIRFSVSYILIKLFRLKKTPLQAGKFARFFDFIQMRKISCFKNCKQRENIYLLSFILPGD